MHLTTISRSNYLSYLEKEATERATWQGKAAQLLELEGEQVTPKNYRLLGEGIDPIHGEVLRTRERHPLSRNGKEFAWPTAVYDATLIAPKTVSVLSVVDERIPHAHQESVGEVLPFMESLSAVKRDRHLAQTGNAIYAAFPHHANRELDPQEHTHIAVINLSFDPVKEKWRALAAYDMYRAGTPIQDEYRERLMERLHQFGYSIREDGREVEGISPAIIEKFSTRDVQINGAREKFYETYGEWPSKGEMNVLVRSFRDDKQFLPLAEIRERQLARLEPAEREQLVTVKERALERYVPVEYETWRPNPYNLEPKSERQIEETHKLRLPHLQDSVESEEALAHRPWRYAERTKERQRLGV